MQLTTSLTNSPFTASFRQSELCSTFFCSNQLARRCVEAPIRFGCTFVHLIISPFACVLFWSQLYWSTFPNRRTLFYTLDLSTPLTLMYTYHASTCHLRSFLLQTSLRVVLYREPNTFQCPVRASHWAAAFAGGHSERSQSVLHWSFLCQSSTVPCHTSRPPISLIFPLYLLSLCCAQYCPSCVVCVTRSFTPSQLDHHLPFDCHYILTNGTEPSETAPHGENDFPSNLTSHLLSFFPIKLLFSILAFI